MSLAVLRQHRCQVMGLAVVCTLLLVTVLIVMAPLSSPYKSITYINDWHTHFASQSAGYLGGGRHPSQLVEHSGDLLTPVTSSQRHVTSLVLCDPIEHSSPTAVDMEEHWIKIPIPDIKNHYWAIYDVELQPENGEIRIPLLRYFFNEQGKGVWLSAYFEANGQLWIQDLAARRSIWCEAHYEDGTSSKSFGRVQWLGLSMGGIEKIPYFSCALDYFKIPTHINLSHVVNNSSRYTFNTNVPYLNNLISLRDTVTDIYTVTLPICKLRRPVHYAVAQLRALYSFRLPEILDWVHYHYAIGFDHFYFHHRYKLPPNDMQTLQPYIDAGMITVRRFPIGHGRDGNLDVNTDQNALLKLTQMRTARTTTWVMAVDHDEYLWLDTPFYPRQCNSSLWCRSPIKDWLESHKQYSMIQFDSINVVPDQPPEALRLANDSYRSALFDPRSGSRVPLPVRRVWRRAQSTVGVIRHSKWIYHAPTTTDFTVHGGGGIRPTWKDYVRKEALIYHFHDYPISSAKDEAVKAKELDEFWTKEAVRDTFLSDVYETLPWPADTDQRLVQTVRPYMGVQTPKKSVKS